MEGVFQLKSPPNVIAQEINGVNGGLVLKPKLLCAEIGKTTHMRILLLNLVKSQQIIHILYATYSLK